MAATLYPPGKFLILICVSGIVDPLMLIKFFNGTDVTGKPSSAG
jgi:hypothetical protein